MTIGERIKKTRKALDLTQQVFADRLGMKQNTIATYEMNRTNPSDLAVKSICREFNVNEEWLRIGKGEMFIRRSKEDELTEFIDELLTEESTEFRRRLVTALSRLRSEQWDALEAVVLGLMKDISVPDTSSSTAPTHIPNADLLIEQEVEQEVELYRQQLILEKKRASQASSVKGSGAG